MTNNYLSLIKHNLEKDINNNFVDAFSLFYEGYSKEENEKFLKEKVEINLKISLYSNINELNYVEDGIVKINIGVFDFLLLKLIENFKRKYALSKKTPTLSLNNLEKLDEQQKNIYDLLLKNINYTDNMKFIYPKSIMGEDFWGTKDNILLYLSFNENLSKENYEKHYELISNFKTKKIEDNLKKIFNIRYNKEKKELIDKILKIQESQILVNFSKLIDESEKFKGNFCLSLIEELIERKEVTDEVKIKVFNSIFHHQGATFLEDNLLKKNLINIGESINVKSIDAPISYSSNKDIAKRVYNAVVLHFNIKNKDITTIVYLLINNQLSYVRENIPELNEEQINEIAIRNNIFSKYGLLENFIKSYPHKISNNSINTLIAIEPILYPLLKNHLLKNDLDENLKKENKGTRLKI